MVTTVYILAQKKGSDNSPDFLFTLESLYRSFYIDFGLANRTQLDIRSNR